MILSIPTLNGNYAVVGKVNAYKASIIPKTLPLLKGFPETKAKKVLKAVTKINPPFVTERRYHLHRETLQCNAGLLCWIKDPNVNINANTNSTNTSNHIPTCCVGFVIDIIQLLMSRLHLDLKLYEVGDGKYGSKENGTWNGIIGDLYNKKADLGMSFLSITKVRSKIVDFPAPFLLGEIAIATMIKERELEFINLEAFVPLNCGWPVVFGISFLGSILLVFAERSVCERQKRYTLKDSLTYVFGLTFQRDIGGDNPHHHSSRTMAVTIACGMMIIMTAYTAVLTAQKINFAVDKPITGFDDPKVG